MRSTAGAFLFCRRPLVLLSACLAALLLFAAAPMAADDIPFELQTELEEPLEKWVKELLLQKNDEGYPYKRGIYSKTFRATGDGGYKVTAHRGTALAGQLQVERLELQLADSGGRWTIASEKVVDTYDGLYRFAPRDETFHSFDRVDLDVEGLHITASGGSLIKDYRNGKLERLTLSADNLKYTYVPPVADDAEMLEYMKIEGTESDLEFDPAWANLDCDPATCEDLLSRSVTGVADITKDQLHDRLRQAHNEYVNETVDDLKEDGFNGFFRLYDADRRRLSTVLRRQGVADHYLVLQKDNWEPREVTLLVSDLGRILQYYSAETRASGIPLEQLERRPDIEGSFVDVTGVEGTVELGIDNAELLVADMKFTMKTLRPMREVPFRIAQQSRSSDTQAEAKNPRMTVNGVHDMSGRELTFVKTGPVSGYVVLPEEVPAGADLAIQMAFQNTDSINKQTPSYSNVSRSGWLPFLRASDMLDTLDLTVKVRGKYKTLAVGTLVEEKKEENVSVTRWVAKNRVAFPTVVYGDYITDKPSVKVIGSDGVEVPVVMHVDRDAIRAFDLRPKQLRPLANNAANALNLYAEVFGVAYPYGKLDLVNDYGGFGAQSPASMVYIGGSSFRGEGIVGSFTSAGDTTRFVKALVPHEVGHQWFLGLIGFSNNRSYWFIESLAEYASSIYVEQAYGQDDYREMVKNWRKNTLDHHLMNSVADARVMASSFAEYQAAVYNQGAYVFHMMRETWGDEKFIAFLKNLAKTYAHREIVTSDIQRAAEQTFGNPMGWFFDQWVRGVGLPEYTVDYTTRRAEDGGEIVQGRVRQQIVCGKQAHVRPNRHYIALVRLNVKGKKETYTKPLRIQGPETEFSFKVPEKVRGLTFNEAGEVLARNVTINGGGTPGQ